jgi:hypothetical protein
MSTPDWRSRTEAELKQAEQARKDGNEGMARVCARRAAGIIIGEYFHRGGFSHGDASAYGRLKKLHQYFDLPDEVQQVAGHFLLRINPDHSLPLQVDLIAEARWLANALLEVEI